MIKDKKKSSIEIHDMIVSYGTKPVLWNINIQIPTNKIIGVIGPNGAGKSTLLKAIMGLIPIDNGSIKIFGQSLQDIRLKVSYVPQKETVDWDFPASVYDIVMMGRYQYIGFFKRPGNNDKKIVITCMEKLDILKLKNRQISQLSGGQQQRVFLARALAQEADIYLMDEPFSAIDISTENTIINLFKEMVQDLGKTIIIVHHDIYSVKTYFDWTVLLNMRIIDSGPTEQVLTADNFKETFGTHLNILREASKIIKKEGIPVREDKFYKNKSKK